MTTYIPTDFANLEALDETEYLSETEIAEILEREQAEANARFGKKAFDPNQPRDAEGQWTDTGGGGTAQWEDEPYTVNYRSDQNPNKDRRNYVARITGGDLTGSTGKLEREFLDKPNWQKTGEQVLSNPQSGSRTVETFVPLVPSEDGLYEARSYKPHPTDRSKDQQSRVYIAVENGIAHIVNEGQEDASDYQHLVGRKDFTERLHPRDDHGRFTDTGSLGDTAIRSGGFSLSMAGDRPHSGWMVSQFGTERSVSIESLASEQPMEANIGNPWHDNVKAEVERFVREHRADLLQPGAYLGGWVDSGRLFLDVSHNIQDEDEAMQYARDNHQFAAYNASTGEYRSFEEERRAASRNTGVKTSSEKVLLKVDEDTDLDELTTRLMQAVFE